MDKKSKSSIRNFFNPIEKTTVEPPQANLVQILCIHGYRQNAKIFRERTGAFRKIIKKVADLEFITAPNVVPPMEGAEENQEDQRGWWFSRSDDYFHAQEPSQCVKGYDESLALIRSVFKSMGPFDGVLAFSQGASLLSLLCGIQQRNKDPDIKFNFAIFVAGFKSRSSPHDELYSTKVTIPTLHVYGDTDRVIEKGLSVELLQYYDNPVILEHTGGHFIPATSAQKKVYLEFLENMKKLKAERT